MRRPVQDFHVRNDHLPSNDQQGMQGIVANRLELMERLVSTLIDDARRRQLQFRYYHRARRVLESLPLPTDEFVLAVRRLENALAYADTREFGAAAFELRMLRRQLQPRTADSPCSAGGGLFRTIFLLLIVASVPVQALAGPKPVGEIHPLEPVFRLAERGVAEIDARVRDYTCTIIMRVRHEGRLKPYQIVEARVRHARTETDTPFSVYLRFHKPSSVAGREVLYVDGRHANKMLVRRGGRSLAYVTSYVDPNGSLALHESKYPVTQIGLKELAKMLLANVKEDMQHGECIVQYFKNARIGDVRCTRIVVEHPHKREHFRYHRAVVFVDEQRYLPIAFAAYLWPETPGGKPVLVEECIYANLKLNVDLADEDFDRTNPDFGFLKQDRIAARN